MKGLLMLVTLMSLVSCASTHPGNMGEELHNQKKEDFIVSAEVVSEFSDPTLSFINITMENKSDKWMRIKSADFSCGEECNKKVNIIVGEDLVVWAKSKKEQIAINNYNSDLLRGALAASGLILAAVAEDESLKTAGVVVAAGAAGGSVVSSLSRDKKKLENPNWVPEEHVYMPTSVPTSLFTRKWILVNHPKDFDMKAFLLRLKTVEDEELTYVFKI